MVFFLAVALHSAGQEPPLQELWKALYEGTIGGSPVVVYLYQVRQTTSTARDPAVPVEGLYYYRRIAKHLTLLRAPDHRGLVECTESSDGDEPCPKPTGIWDVEVTEDRVTGTWRASSGAPPKVVKLARRAIGKSPAAGLPEVYYDMLREDLRRSIVVEGRRHGIVWKTERRGSGADARTGRIVLLQSPDAAARERINQRLKKDIRYPDSPADCDERLFAIAGSAYTSGGAHPSSGFEAITFDLRTGEEVDWWRIVRVNDAPVGSAAKLELGRGDLIAGYVLRAALEDPDDCLSAVIRHYRCDMSSCASGPDPEHDAWILYPTIDGLAVSPQVYGEAERGCRDASVIVPWPDARKTLLRPMILP
jgi:hypothetical protein